MSRDTIFRKVRSMLIAALAVDEKEVTLASRLQRDLGAESIDFLDIIFRLEREFGIRIPRGELFPEAIFQEDPDFVDWSGRLTSRGLRLLRETMLFADLDDFAKDPTIARMSDLFTVDWLVDYVVSKVGIS